ncbi:MAG: DnaD domain-containing protein [Thermacetogeniaceae bacterium]
MEDGGRFLPALFSKDFFTAGFTSIPNLLFKYSQRLNLESIDLLVIIVLLHFQQAGKRGPSLKDFATAINSSVEKVQASLERLRYKGLIDITADGVIDPAGLFEKIMDLWAIEKMQSFQKGYNEVAVAKGSADRGETPYLNNLICAFEQEFGRALTPIEFEQINRWSSVEGYSEELILEALKRAVLQGVCNFKYIDRILSHWAKRNLRTVREVEQYEERYFAQRQMKKSRDNQAFAKWEEREEKYRDLYANRVDE